MDDDGVPEGWEVWTESDLKAVLVFRPDVFDGDAFPAPCMPTVYVTKGKRRRKPGRDVRPGDPWYVTLYLEPDVNADRESYETREGAAAAARDLARRRTAGRGRARRRPPPPWSRMTPCRRSRRVRDRA